MSRVDVQGRLPPLVIRLTKRRGKPPLLICRRADGTETIAVITVGPIHDLIHYAVESTLGFDDAFFGLVARGWDISDFDVPAAAQRLRLPPRAALTEFIVGLFQVELVNGECFDDFQSELERAVAGARRPLEVEIPEISIDQARRVRERVAGLIERWRRTGADESLELPFPPRP